MNRQLVLGILIGAVFTAFLSIDPLKHRPKAVTTDVMCYKYDPYSMYAGWSTVDDDLAISILGYYYMDKFKLPNYAKAWVYDQGQDYY